MNDRAIPGVFAGRSHRLVTERLEIAPLTREEAELYLTDVAKFARRLGLNETPSEPGPGTRNALNWLVDLGLSYDSNTIVYAAIWALVERSTRQFIGVASFKGEPIDGDVEIGYEIDAPFRGKGFMTEAIRAFVEWGRSRPELKGIVAETLKNNLPSQRVLTAAGFVTYEGKEDSVEDGIFWRVDVSTSPIELFA